MDSRFFAYQTTLFGEGAKRTDRDSLEPEEAARLAETIASFLRLLPAYVLLRPAHFTLEFLIKRFQINVRDVYPLMEALLPVHETAFFGRAAQLLAVKGTCFAFLERGVQKHGSPLPRALLGAQCAKDPALLQFVCELASRAAASKAPARQSLALLTTVASSVLTRQGQPSAVTSQALLPASLACIEGQTPDAVASGMVCASMLSAASALAPDATDALVNAVCTAAVARSGSSSAPAPLGQAAAALSAILAGQAHHTPRGPLRATGPCRPIEGVGGAALRISDAALEALATQPSAVAAAFATVSASADVSVGVASLAHSALEAAAAASEAKRGDVASSLGDLLAEVARQCPLPSPEDFAKQLVLAAGLVATGSGANSSKPVPLLSRFGEASLALCQRYGAQATRGLVAGAADAQAALGPDAEAKVRQWLRSTLSGTEHAPVALLGAIVDAEGAAAKSGASTAASASAAAAASEMPLSMALSHPSEEVRSMAIQAGAKLVAAALASAAAACAPSTAGPAKVPDDAADTESDDSDDDDDVDMDESDALRPRGAAGQASSAASSAAAASSGAAAAAAAAAGGAPAAAELPASAVRTMRVLRDAVDAALASGSASIVVTAVACLSDTLAAASPHPALIAAALASPFSSEAMPALLSVLGQMRQAARRLRVEASEHHAAAGPVLGAARAILRFLSGAWSKAAKASTVGTYLSEAAASEALVSVLLEHLPLGAPSKSHNDSLGEAAAVACARSCLTHPFLVRVDEDVVSTQPTLVPVLAATGIVDDAMTAARERRAPTAPSALGLLSKCAAASAPCGPRGRWAALLTLDAVVSILSAHVAAAAADAASSKTADAAAIAQACTQALSEAVAAAAPAWRDAFAEATRARGAISLPKRPGRVPVAAFAVPGSTDLSPAAVAACSAMDLGLGAAASAPVESDTISPAAARALVAASALFRVVEACRVLEAGPAGGAPASADHAGDDASPMSADPAVALLRPLAASMASVTGASPVAAAAAAATATRLRIAALALSASPAMASASQPLVVAAVSSSAAAGSGALAALSALASAGGSLSTEATLRATALAASSLRGVASAIGTATGTAPLCAPLVGGLLLLAPAALAAASHAAAPVRTEACGLASALAAALLAAGVPPVVGAQPAPGDATAQATTAGRLLLAELAPVAPGLDVSTWQTTLGLGGASVIAATLSTIAARPAEIAGSPSEAGRALSASLAAASRSAVEASTLGRALTEAETAVREERLSRAKKALADGAAAAEDAASKASSRRLRRKRQEAAAAEKEVAEAAAGVLVDAAAVAPLIPSAAADAAAWLASVSEAMADTREHCSAALASCLASSRGGAAVAALPAARTLARRLASRARVCGGLPRPLVRLHVLCLSIVRAAAAEVSAARPTLNRFLQSAGDGSSSSAAPSKAAAEEAARALHRAAQAAHTIAAACIEQLSAAPAEARCWPAGALPPAAVEAVVPTTSAALARALAPAAAFAGTTADEAERAAGRKGDPAGAAALAAEDVAFDAVVRVRAAAAAAGVATHEVSLIAPLCQVLTSVEVWQLLRLEKPATARTGTGSAATDALLDVPCLDGCFALPLALPRPGADSALASAMVRALLQLARRGPSAASSSARDALSRVALTSDDILRHMAATGVIADGAAGSGTASALRLGDGFALPAVLLDEPALRAAASAAAGAAPLEAAPNAPPAAAAALAATSQASLERYIAAATATADVIAARLQRELDAAASGPSGAAAGAAATLAGMGRPLGLVPVLFHCLRVVVAAFEARARASSATDAASAASSGEGDSTPSSPGRRREGGAWAAVSERAASVAGANFCLQALLTSLHLAVRLVPGSAVGPRAAATDSSSSSSSSSSGAAALVADTSDASADAATATAAMDSALVAAALHASDSPPTQAAAVSLLAAMARIHPRAVLRRLLPVLVMVGSGSGSSGASSSSTASAAARSGEDAASFVLTQQLVDAVVPVVVRHGADAGLGTGQLVRVFASCADAVPAHRRLALFQGLVSTAAKGTAAGGASSEGAASQLAAVTALLVSSHVLPKTRDFSVRHAADARHPSAMSDAVSLYPVHAAHVERLTAYGFREDDASTRAVFGADASGLGGALPDPAVLVRRASQLRAAGPASATFTDDLDLPALLDLCRALFQRFGAREQVDAGAALVAAAERLLADAEAGRFSQEDGAAGATADAADAEEAGGADGDTDADQPSAAVDAFMPALVHSAPAYGAASSLTPAAGRHSAPSDAVATAQARLDGDANAGFRRMTSPEARAVAVSLLRAVGTHLGARAFLRAAVGVRPGSAAGKALQAAYLRLCHRLLLLLDRQAEAEAAAGAEASSQQARAREQAAAARDLHRRRKSLGVAGKAASEGPSPAKVKALKAERDAADSEAQAAALQAENARRARRFWSEIGRAAHGLLDRTALLLTADGLAAVVGELSLGGPGAAEAVALATPHDSGARAGAVAADTAVRRRALLLLASQVAARAGTITEDDARVLAGLVPDLAAAAAATEAPMVARQAAVAAMHTLGAHLARTLPEEFAPVVAAAAAIAAEGASPSQDRAAEDLTAAALHACSDLVPALGAEAVSVLPAALEAALVAAEARASFGASAPGAASTGSRHVVAAAAADVLAAAAKSLPQFLPAALPRLLALACAPAFARTALSPAQLSTDSMDADAAAAAAADSDDEELDAAAKEEASNRARAASSLARALDAVAEHAPFRAVLPRALDAVRAASAGGSASTAATDAGETLAVFLLSAVASGKRVDVVRNRVQVLDAALLLLDARWSRGAAGRAAAAALAGGAPGVSMATVDRVERAATSLLESLVMRLSEEHLRSLVARLASWMAAPGPDLADAVAVRMGAAWASASQDQRLGTAAFAGMCRRIAGWRVVAALAAKLGDLFTAQFVVLLPDAVEEVEGITELAGAAAGAKRQRRATPVASAADADSVDEDSDEEDEEDDEEEEQSEEEEEEDDDDDVSDGGESESAAGAGEFDADRAAVDPLDAASVAQRVRALPNGGKAVFMALCHADDAETAIRSTQASPVSSLHALRVAALRCIGICARFDRSKFLTPTRVAAIVGAVRAAAASPAVDASVADWLVREDGPAESLLSGLGADPSAPSATRRKRGRDAGAAEPDEEDLLAAARVVAGVAGGRERHTQFVRDAVVPVVRAVVGSTAADEGGWKRMVHTACQLARAPRGAVRVAGMAIVAAVFERGQEEALALLPEALPALRECLGDRDEAVEAEARSLAASLEKLSGEDLADYLR
ncbi:hypothetical protein FNF27_00110 [Cafeteria roenbergensis]|uniref:HEAT repeat-containing protein 1 n=1 Tax=Cafeteria roenbergensis TaxID=33653 RepID=A0A5A8ENK4_CAFRO|nr:hypothetical protein FNF27_00110 [Cafeteria roenbergensis]